MKVFKILQHRYLEKLAIKDLFSIIIGSVILAGSIQCILVPARLLNGGVSGLSILLKLATGIDVWFWYALINIPIFIAGYKYINRRFIIYSLIGTAVLSLFLGLFKSMQFTLDDTLLAALFGGAMSGIGSGLVFRGKGSSGGTDIIAVIIKQRWGYSLGQTFFAINIVIIGVFALLSGVKPALFSVITIFISSQVVDRVLAGPEISRTVMIISHRHQEICDAIMNTIHRGCTLLTGKGGYTGGEQYIILTTVAKMQLPGLKDLVSTIDPQAFMIINETIEVYGKGFKASGTYL